MDFEEYIIARDKFDIGIITIVFGAGLAFRHDHGLAGLSSRLGWHDDDEDD